MTRKEIEQLYVEEPNCFETDREEQWYKVGLKEGLAAADSHSHWISVEDELPPKFERVLVYIGIDRLFDIAYLENVINKQTWWMNNRREIFHVTHWMPLPVPPRKEVKNET